MLIELFLQVALFPDFDMFRVALDDCCLQIMQDYLAERLVIGLEVCQAAADKPLVEGVRFSAWIGSFSISSPVTATPAFAHCSCQRWRMTGSLDGHCNGSKSSWGGQVQVPPRLVMPYGAASSGNFFLTPLLELRIVPSFFLFYCNPLVRICLAQQGWSDG